ncbi:MAG: hypothetical protein WD767_06910 [Alphaproteobacteria bacterium]
MTPLRAATAVVHQHRDPRLPRQGAQRGGKLLRLQRLLVERLQLRQHCIHVMALPPGLLMAQQGDPVLDILAGQQPVRRFLRLVGVVAGEDGGPDCQRQPHIGAAEPLLARFRCGVGVHVPFRLIIQKRNNNIFR